MKKITKRVEELFFPPVTCLVCGEELTESVPRGVCAACEEKLPVNDGVRCTVCGRAMKRPGVCMHCRGIRTYFDEAASPFRYEGVARDMVLRLKLQNARYFAPYLAYHLANCFVREGWRADTVVSVPMRRWELFSRGFNQARLLAERTAALIGLPYRDLLVKSKRTRRQSALKFTDRQVNVKNAYSVRQGEEELAGKTVLLVDDIFTTGATVSACANALKKAGASAVYALTVCSVPEVMPASAP